MPPGRGYASVYHGLVELSYPLDVNGALHVDRQYLKQLLAAQWGLRADDVMVKWTVVRRRAEQQDAIIQAVYHTRPVRLLASILRNLWVLDRLASPASYC